MTARADRTFMQRAIETREDLAAEAIEHGKEWFGADPAAWTPDNWERIIVGALDRLNREHFPEVAELFKLRARLDASPIAPPGEPEGPVTQASPETRAAVAAMTKKWPVDEYTQGILNRGAPPGEPTAPVQTWATDLAGMPVDSVPPTAVDPEVPRWSSKPKALFVDVDCPKCGAIAGQRCRANGTHAERRRAGLHPAQSRGERR